MLADQTLHLSLSLLAPAGAEVFFISPDGQRPAELSRKITFLEFKSPFHNLFKGVIVVPTVWSSTFFYDGTFHVRKINLSH